MIDETAAEIREMQTHSSSVVAVKAARALREVTEREHATVEEYLRTLDRESSALRRANPSHATLQTTQRDIVAAVEDDDPETVAAARERTLAAIEDAVAAVEDGKHEAAANAAAELDDGATLLTHDYSSTVIEAAELATDRGATLEFYVTEARPRFLGRRTARALAGADIDAHLVVDGAAGHCLADCDEVILGMDCIVDDTLYNRVGTYPLAATAADAGVPVTVVGSSAKLVEEGFRFENDFRATSEVIREPPEGFDVLNPAYDATPVRLIDRVITDEGVTEF
jgi:translation initiation factor eIF-2B subunit delta